MSGFSAPWLAAREPVDHAARSDEILAAVGHYFINDPAICVTDIGCGTGSTVRALSPCLNATTRWHLIDNDAALMEQARETLSVSNLKFSQHNLSQSIDILLEENPSLLTTSAFLDLVSEDWLERLCNLVAENKIPFYAALSYNGRNTCRPAHALDDEVLQAFNRHQRTDKGFGPALGPEAASTAIKMFEAAGFEVIAEPSDWIGDSRHPEFQKMLLEGWCQAACEIDPASAENYRDWLAERLAMINQGISTVEVGHVDFFAIPGE